MTVKTSSKPRTRSQKKMLVGWREWCALPELGLPVIRAKVDTGAATSSLHALNITPFKEKGKQYIRFTIHPLQKNRKVVRTCVAPVVEKRLVTDSGGHEELRYVVSTTLAIYKKSWEIEITLTDRSTMVHRMLLGRSAMKGRLTVDPQKTHLLGRRTPTEVRQAYKDTL